MAGGMSRLITILASSYLVSFYALVLSFLFPEASGFMPTAIRWTLGKPKHALRPVCNRGIANVRCAAGGGERERESGNMGREDRSRGGRIDEPCSRRDVFRLLGLAGSAVVLGQGLVGQAAAAVTTKEELPTVGKITKSGVKYFEYRVGSGDSPRWGQDCVVRFVMYGRATPGAQLVKIDSSDNNGEPYLFKHGNGRQIKGMDEGLHSMRVGGKRRIVIPRELGYTVQGLGPYPANSRNRDILGEVLKSFEKSPGELVMDIELLDVFDDEADQGYYEDETPTLEELQQIINDTGQFAGDQTFERLPGQTAIPAEDGPTKEETFGGQLPGELGQSVGS